jgi:hypothetical protein
VLGRKERLQSRIVLRGKACLVLPVATPTFTSTVHILVVFDVIALAICVVDNITRFDCSLI